MDTAESFKIFHSFTPGVHISSDITIRNVCLGTQLPVLVDQSSSI